MTPTYIWGSFLKDNLSTIFLRIFDNHLFIVITSSALGTGPVRFSTRQTTRSSFPSTSNVLPVVIFFVTAFSISRHAPEPGPKQFFPPTEDGSFDRVGEGDGAGFNINVPFCSPDERMTDADYLVTFQSIVVPVVRAYNPDLIFVSLGFDAAKDDGLCDYKLSAGMYSYMIKVGVQLTFKNF